MSWWTTGRRKRSGRGRVPLKRGLRRRRLPARRERRQGRQDRAFIPDLPRSGRYEVRLSYTVGANRATNVPVTVFGADGERPSPSTSGVVPPIDGRLIYWGVLTSRRPGRASSVSNERTDGHVIADAVQFLPADAVAAAPANDAKGGTTGNAEANRLREMEAELKRLTDFGPKRDAIISVVEESAEELGDAKVHVRGSVHTLGAPVPRGFLGGARRHPPPSRQQSGGCNWRSGRHPDNPLPARWRPTRVCMAGRCKARPHRGHFGTTGEAPSHPNCWRISP